MIGDIMDSLIVLYAVYIVLFLLFIGIFGYAMIKLISFACSPLKAAVKGIKNIMNSFDVTFINRVKIPVDEDGERITFGTAKTAEQMLAASIAASKILGADVVETISSSFSDLKGSGEEQMYEVCDLDTLRTLLKEKSED